MVGVRIKNLDLDMDSFCEILLLRITVMLQSLYPITCSILNRDQSVMYTELSRYMEI